MSAVPNNTPPGQLPITQEKLLDVIAKSNLSTTSNGCYGQICTLKVPNPRAGGQEMRAWDGVQRGSPVEEYLKKARGGLDPVRGDSWHFQQSASVKDGIVLEIEGHVIGKIVGPVVGAASALMPMAKEAAKTAFKSASEAAVRAGKSVSESASIAAKAASEAAVKTLNSAKKAVSDGVAVLLKKARKLSPAEHKAWLEKNGYKNPDSHVSSADPSKPVEIIQLKKGDEVWMYVRDGGQPGNYATTPGTGPDLLAIDGAGRHVEIFTVKEPFEVVRSTAGEFATGKYPGVGGPGGGTQYQLPADFLKNVNKLGK
jgi:hypothetical protein